MVRRWLMDHPKFYNNPLYVVGDSYSGIIVPIVVKEISDGNRNEHVPPMNLKGYVLGNPVTDSEKDENSRVLFSYLNTLISDELYQSTKRNCEGDYINVDLNNSLCVSDLELYNEILESSCAMPSLKSARSKWYANDLSNKDSVNLLLSFPQLHRPWCRHYDYIFTYIWANDKTVQDALHIQEGSIKEWSSRKSYLSPIHGVIMGGNIQGAGHTAPQYKPEECHAMISRWFAYYPL
ncbi:unnamed protein product [Prunus armeniaca]